MPSLHYVIDAGIREATRKGLTREVRNLENIQIGDWADCENMDRQTVAYTDWNSDGEPEADVIGHVRDILEAMGIDID